jgi:hypothetical protein
LESDITLARHKNKWGKTGLSKVNNCIILPLSMADDFIP